MEIRKKNKFSLKKLKKASIALLCGAVLIGQAACMPLNKQEIAYLEEEISAPPKIVLEAIDHPDIEMNVTVGFNGTYQMSGWNTMRATITNNGADFDGQVVMPMEQDNNNYYMGNSNKIDVMDYAVNVNIPSGSSKTIELAFKPAMIKKELAINLESNGEIVERVIARDLTAIAAETKFAGILSDAPESLAYWKSGKFTGNPMNEPQSVELSADTFPSNNAILEPFLILIIDDFDINTLDDKQRSALENWLNRGGTILLGSGANAQKTLSGFEGIADLDYGEFLKVTGVSKSLQSFVSGSKALESELRVIDLGNKDNSILWLEGQELLWDGQTAGVSAENQAAQTNPSQSMAQQQEQTQPQDQTQTQTQPQGQTQTQPQGQIMANGAATAGSTNSNASTKGLSLINRYKVGEGYILLTAFDLGKKPYSSWDASTALIGAQLNEIPNLAKLSSQQNAFYYDPYYNPFESVLTNIPAGELPSMGLVFAILAAFCAVIGPLLYFFLKKRDRRDWAWWLIPCIAVVTALGIAAMGLKNNRNEVLASSVTVYEPVAQGVANGETQIGVFIPSKGKSKISVDKDGLPDIYRSYDMMRYASSSYMGYFGSSSVTTIIGYQGKEVEKQENVIGRVIQGANPAVEFDSKSDWSMGYMTLDSHSNKVGMLEGTLSSVDGEIKGKLKNNTGYDIQQLILLGYSSYLALEDVPAGAEIDVELKRMKPSDPGISMLSYYTGYELFYNVVGEIYTLDPDTNYDREWIQEVNMKSSALRAVFDTRLSRLYEQSNVASSVNAIALISDDDNFNISFNDKKVDKEYKTSAIYHGIPMVFEADGRVDIPQGVINASLIASESTENANIDRYSLYFYSQATATIMLKIPESERYSIEEFVIHTQAQSAGKMIYKIWDFKKQPISQGEIDAWEIVNPGDPYMSSNQKPAGNPPDQNDAWVEFTPGKKMTEQDVARFINQDGIIKIQIHPDETDTVYAENGYQSLTTPSIALKGKVK